MKIEVVDENSKKLGDILIREGQIPRVGETLLIAGGEVALREQSFWVMVDDVYYVIENGKIEAQVEARELDIQLDNGAGRRLALRIARGYLPLPQR